MLGYEKVDELAKDAANGRSSARIKLPHILRDPLPNSASATKQAYYEKLKERWDDRWEASERSHRMNEIDNNFPFNGYRRRTHILSRNQASLMTQIRCGHIPLNGYLHKISKSETMFCQACLDSEDNLHNRETVKQFLFACPSLSQEREVVRLMLTTPYIGPE